MLRYEMNSNTNTSSSNPNTKLESISLSNHAAILEFYWNGCYGKSTLSRGLPSWFKRHFFKSEYTPKGLVELKKHENFIPDLVDWYSEEWEKYQELADGLDEMEKMKVRVRVSWTRRISPFSRRSFFLIICYWCSWNKRWTKLAASFSTRMLDTVSWKLAFKIHKSLSKYTNRFDFNQESIPNPKFLPTTLLFNTPYTIIFVQKVGLQGTHLTSRYWIAIRSGLNLGFDILLYKKGPQYSHAEFCVWVVPKNYKIDNWKLIGKVRVASNVKKVRSHLFLIESNPTLL